MLIDWFTLIAQAINFLILAAFLQHFLFAPILKRVEERRRELKEKEERAGEREREAEEKRRLYEERQEELKREGQQRLKKAEKRAKEREEELIQEAKERVEQKKKAWLEELEEEKDSRKEEIQKRLESAVLSVSKKLLEKFADADLQERMLRVFLERLQEIESGEVPQGSERIFIRSSFEIPSAWKERLSKQAERLFGEVEFRYILDRELSGALLLEADSFRLLWSPYDYLESLAP